MSAPLLSVRGVKAFYGRVMALKGVDLDVNEGEIVDTDWRKRRRKIDFNDDGLR